MESFLTTVSNLIWEKQLPALMIGGHAVTALGHPRATFDLDLLIPRSSTEAWKAELSTLRYRTFSETSYFLQFEAHPDLPLPPVDLMLVDDAVFEILFATKSDSAPIATPSVLSMIALKLHAINQPSRVDTEKDWSDIFALIRAHKLYLDDPDLSAIIQKHGGQSAIDRIKAAGTGEP
jgi:hypothetical protein